MEDIKRIEKMISILKDMKRDSLKVSRLMEKDFTEMTQRQIQKRNTDAGWVGMENIKRKCELHALAVELGFADYRKDGYAEIRLTDGWQNFTHKPREPYSE